MTLQSIKQNPDLIKDDMRRMAAKINELVAVANRSYYNIKSVSITASQSVDDTATLFYASSTGGAVNLTLTSAANVTDRYYGLMKIDNSTNAVSFHSSDGINGSTSSSTTTQYNITWVHSDGTTWRKI